MLGTKSLACEMITNLPTITYSCRINSFEEIERNVRVWIQKPRVVSNNSVNINISQKVLGTKSLAYDMIINLPLLLILVGLIVSKILREMYTVRIQKPRVVSNNSVNIIFSQNVLGTKSLACEMIINLPQLLILVGLIVSKILREMYSVRIQKPEVVSNNSVNINISQKVLVTKSLACDMIINLPLLLIPVGLIVSKILREMYTSGFKNHELCQITP